MKTFILKLLLFFFIFQSVSAQFKNSYVDALKKKRLDSIVSLQDNIKKNTYSIDVESINDRYAYFFENYNLIKDSLGGAIPKNIDLTKYNSIKSLHNLKFNFNIVEKLNNDSDVIVKEGTPASFSSIESLAVNALSTFIAGRLKQEALHFAIHGYFKKIIDPKTDAEKNEAKIVGAFFPSLTNQIKQLYNDGNSSYYSADLVYLSQIAKNDLNNIPSSLTNNVSILLPKASNPVKDVLLIGTSILKDSKNETPLNEIISNLYSNKYNDDAIKDAVNLLVIISESLRNEEEKSELWINPKTKLDPTKIDSNPLIKDTYAFLYSQLIEIPKVKKYIEQDGTALNVTAKRIYNLLDVVTDLNGVYNGIKAKNFKLSTIEEKISYIKDINSSVTSFINKINTLNIFKIDASCLSKSESYLTILESFLNKDYTAGLTQLTIAFSDSISDTVKYSRLLNFTSQLATVKNSEEMEKMLNGFAAPIGSSSVKRTSAFSISLNSYAGLNFGYEKILSSTSNGVNGNYFGVTAPIGFAFSGLLSKTGTWSVIVSALDLGSLVNTRINNDTTTYANLKFEHFFTPGFGIAYNFKGSPVTLGLFGNYISNLKDINYSDGVATITATNKDVFRMNISLLIDIPLLSIYKK